MKVIVDHNPAEDKLEDLGIRSWPIWEKEVSEFPWQYTESETCYILEGEVTVTPAGGTPVLIKAGDLVTFPKGMACRWQITKDIRKHYKLG